jgi:arylsulfatase A-like enzyme
MDYLKHQMIDKAIADYWSGKMSRREFLRQLAIVGGGTALGLTILGNLACGPSLATPVPGGIQNQPGGGDNFLAATPDPPNILFIVIDTLRADHVSCYGYERPTSPNIDSLARQGVLFEIAISTAPYTAPSHASLLTGRYPYQHGVQWVTRRPVFDGRYLTLPEALQAHGYRTAAFSANRFWFTREQGFGRGFNRFKDTFRSPVQMAMRTVYGHQIEASIVKGISEDYPWRTRASGINRSVLHWLKQDSNRPFFAFVNYFDVHDPYFPPRSYRGKFSALENPGGIVNSYQNRFNPQMTPQQVQDEIDAYDGAISYADDHIAQLLTQIGDLGLGENLLVIITSDHGEAFGEHGAFLHPNSVYREEIHVPLVIWQPDRIPAGVRVSQPVTIASLPATVMELVGQGEQDIFPEQSLVRFWENPELPSDSPFPLAEMEHWPWMFASAPSSQGAMRSLVTPEYHYIEHDTLGRELYDWRRDPRELHNLADTREGQAKIDQFRSLVEKDYRNVKDG